MINHRTLKTNSYTVFKLNSRLFSFKIKQFSFKAKSSILCFNASPFSFKNISPFTHVMPNFNFKTCRKIFNFKTDVSLFKERAGIVL